MIADFDDIAKLAQECFDRALNATKTMQLSETRGKSASVVEAESPFLPTDPKFAALPNAYGMSAYAVTLCADLRRSSQRATRIGAKHTYLTMHTFLPTMLALVPKAGGQIVGLRGDGIIGAFGITERQGDKQVFTTEISNAAIKSAVRCGKAMIEATADILNPLLTKNDIEADLAIGVAIDYGEIVITRIGLREANEVTAYGPPVNRACKSTSHATQEVLLSVQAHNI